MRRVLGVVLLAAAGCGGDPTDPGAAGFAAVTAGDTFSCALARDGRAFCWGSGVFGQLGDGAATATFAPVAVAGEHRFTAISAGDAHTCAIDTDGAAWCWGLNDFRELGTQTTFCNPNFQFLSCAARPVRVGGAVRFTAVGVAGYHSCALSADSLAWCWGWNSHGQLGAGALDDVITEPQAVAGGRKFARLSVDQFHACAVEAAGDLWCWGRNDQGQLGVVTTDDCSTSASNPISCALVPVAAAGGLAFADVATGRTHTCGITRAGEAFCWGSNRYGVIGNPTSFGGLAPVPVSGTGPWTDVSAGFDHVCARRDDGSVACWGLNHFGQLGSTDASEACPADDTPRACRTSPQPLAAPPLARVSAGTQHSCGLGANGAIWCWGRGSEGQLGTGDAITRSVPIRLDLSR